jgi:hypothetical protein
MQHRIEQRPPQAAGSVLVQSRTHRREQRFVRKLHGVRDEVAGDQLSDYRVDDPYIRGHVHGPCPRSVLDLDNSPTVFRDEVVKAAKLLTDC